MAMLATMRGIPQIFSGDEMMFTSNHDENSWAGTEFERMGDAARVMALLTFTLQMCIRDRAPKRTLTEIPL